MHLNNIAFKFYEKCSYLKTVIKKLYVENEYC